MKTKFFILAWTFLTLLTSTALADDAPAWLRQATSVTPPAYDKDVPAVVLYREEVVSLGSDGQMTVTDRYAVRILTREGRREAAAAAPYIMNFSKVSDVQAWLVAPGGKVTSYGKKETVDQIANTNDVYNESRLKVINASDLADIGYVFGYSFTTELTPRFFQDQWIFQDRLPTLVSRYTLSLPDGWSAGSKTFNHADVTPQRSGNSYTWELRDLSPIPFEPLSPSFSNLAPRLAVDYRPADGQQAVNRAFANWLEVSRYASTMNDPQVIVDDEVAAKARELTADAKTELDAIRAIGSFVQKLQYISIPINFGTGGGDRPRASNVVLSRRYGDCKDKANLMRAMLKALKIESYPVWIYSGDPTFVRKEWASPDQFNHCIIAVKVADTTDAATIITDPKLGRLLVFDATDEYTPVGDLPGYLQGSYALMIAGDNGGLVQMPVTPPEFNGWHRETEVALAGDGSIKGTIRERVSGQEARFARGRYRAMSAGDYNKFVERWVTRGATAASLTKVQPQDRIVDAAFDMDVEFAAPVYGQLMQNRLLVFKPAVVDRSNSIYLTDKDRKHPILLNSTSFNEKVTFSLPVGFAVDEMPDPVNIEMPFGKYATSYDVRDGKLVFTRTLVFNRSTVAVDRYGEVRDFFTKMRDAEQSPVVLIKK